MRERLRASPPRTALALGLLPIVAPMMLFPSLRKLAGSAMLWIASFGLDAPGLQAAFDAFAARLKANQTRLAWRPGGLEALQRHSQQGHRVVVATAAPTGLASALIATLPDPPPVLGSSLRPFAGGWIAHRHCRHTEKCAVLAEAGYGDRWAHAYSDSADDLPLLARAQAAWLINARRQTRLRLKRRLAALRDLSW